MRGYFREARWPLVMPKHESINRLQAISKYGDGARERDLAVLYL